MLFVELTPIACLYRTTITRIKERIRITRTRGKHLEVTARVKKVESVDLNAMPLCSQFGLVRFGSVCLRTSINNNNTNNSIGSGSSNNDDSSGGGSSSNNNSDNDNSDIDASGSRVRKKRTRR